MPSVANYVSFIQIVHYGLIPRKLILNVLLFKIIPRKKPGLFDSCFWAFLTVLENPIFMKIGSRIFSPILGQE